MYSFQTFSFEQILTSAQMNQVEVNVRDHIHGRESVAKTGISFPPTAKSGGFTAAAADVGELFNCTGTFTIDFVAAATLGSGWAITVANVGTGVITLDPNAAETINGLTDLDIGRDRASVVFSDGVNLFTIGAGGLTSISNTAITAVTNIDVTGFLPGAYDNYEAWIDNAQPANDAVQLELETSTDGGSTFDTGASDYTWAVANFIEGATSQFFGDPDDTEIHLLGNAASNAANENVNLKISIFGPEVAEFTNFAWVGSFRTTNSTLISLSGAGERQSAADVDALRFHWSAGDWIAQGKIQFLGIVQ